MYWEIVELEDGDIALVRDDEAEPVLTIGFSAEAREKLSSHHIEVAKAMIGAGMDAVESLQGDVSELDNDDWLADEPDSETVIH